MLRALKNLAKPLELSEYVKEECTNKDIYVCSATNGKDCGVLLTYCNGTDEIIIDVVLEGIFEGSYIKVYELNKENNMSLYNEFTVGYCRDDEEPKAEIILNMPLFTSYYIEIINKNADSN